MASIKKRGDTYEISVFLGRDDNQKKIRKAINYHPTAKAPKAIEKEVQAFAHEYEQLIKNGEIYSGDDVTFSQFVKIWEENWLPQKTLRIQEDYMLKLRVHFIPMLGHMKLTSIRATHIDAAIKKMKDAGRAPKTIRSAFTVINSVMKYAFKKQYIKENPCLRCDDLPKIERDTELHYFTVEQAKTFLNALTLEYYQERAAVRRHLKNGISYDVQGYSMKHTIPFQFQVYFTMAIYGGFRRGEMIALTWGDVDFENHSVRINKSVSRTKQYEIIKDPKTKAGIREIVLPTDCFELLRKWKTQQRELCMQLGTAWKGFREPDFDKNSIFIDRTDGTRMCLDCPSHKFHEVIDLYNSQYAKNESEMLPRIRLHDLRHTSATLLLAHNTDIETVSKRLGHSKASVTLDIYGHPMKEMDRKAAETLEKLFS